jgi:hypothetical protein
MAAPTAPRHIPNDGPVLRLAGSPRSHIISNLQKLITTYPPDVATFPPDELNGLFSGPTSVAYILFKLSQPSTGYDETQIQGHALRYWADAYLQCARDCVLRADRPGDPPPAYAEARYGIVIELPSRLALEAAFHKDDQAAKSLLALLPEVLASGDDDDGKLAWNEHIYGRTGYLYLLRLVRAYWPDAPIPPSTFAQIVERVLLDGVSKWKFMDHYVLGAGHGWINNIITQILLTDAESYAAACKSVLEQVLDEQIIDPASSDFGNWDAFVPYAGQVREPRRQIQWGHGAPGIVISLTSILPVYKAAAASSEDAAFAARIAAAIDRAQDVIWEKGLLRKESCLCHGAAGNMLALADERRKEHFLACSTEEVVQKGLENGTSEASSYPSSLHRGLAGRIWAFFAFEKRLGGVYPSYNDL